MKTWRGAQGLGRGARHRRRPPFVASFAVGANPSLQAGGARAGEEARPGRAGGGAAAQRRHVVPASSPGAASERRRPRRRSQPERSCWRGVARTSAPIRGAPRPPRAPGPHARRPPARSLAPLPCGRPRHGVGVGGAGGGRAGLRQPLPAGEPRGSRPGARARALRAPPAASGPASGQLAAEARQAALGLGGPRARSRGRRAGRAHPSAARGGTRAVEKPPPGGVSCGSRGGRVPEPEPATLGRHRPGGIRFIIFRLWFDVVGKENK